MNDQKQIIQNFNNQEYGFEFLRAEKLRLELKDASYKFANNTLEKGSLVILDNANKQLVAIEPSGRISTNQCFDNVLDANHAMMLSHALRAASIISTTLNPQYI